jgi:hypothetical protein
MPMKAATISPLTDEQRMIRDIARDFYVSN